MKKAIILSAIIISGVIITGAFGNAASQDKELKNSVVIASTAWTGSIAKAAGADEVRVLAPFELKHPPEYDFRPGDIQKLTAQAGEGSYLVWGGYEPFIPKLIEATNLETERIIKVRTTNVPSNLIQEVKKVALRIDRTERAEEWVRDFLAFTEEIKEKAEEKGVNKVKVLVHIHQKAFVEWLGYNVLTTYSGELSLAKISDLAELEPDLIIDNYHSPDGISIAEVAKVPRIELKNFPQHASQGLKELFLANAEALGIVIEK